MDAPAAPRNVRIVYPGGEVVPVAELRYRGLVGDHHVWQITRPRWPRWHPDVRVDFDDDGDGAMRYVFAGWDVPDGG